MTKINIETEAERLARLEAQVTELQISHAEEKQSIEKIEEDVQSILRELSRYKGFIGGIMFLGACIGAFFKAIPLIGNLFK